MLKKRGSVSVFIVLGILVLLGGGIAFYTLSSSMREEQRSQSIAVDVSPVKSYADSCLAKAVYESVPIFSFWCGLYDIPEEPEGPEPGIPYCFYLGERLLPEKEFMEQEFSKYVESSFKECIGDLSVFREMGYEISIGDVSADSHLGKHASVTLSCPMEIRKGNAKASLDFFQRIEDFDFAKVYSILSDFADEHQKSPDYVPVGFLSLSAYNNNYTFTLSYPDDKKVIYTFLFENVRRHDEPVAFNCAAKYYWPEQSSSRARIRPIPELEAYVGVPFSYRVEGIGEDLEFSAVTGLFEISRDGLIEFTPSEQDIGRHYIHVKAKDKEGNEDVAMMILAIE